MHMHGSALQPRQPWPILGANPMLLAPLLSRAATPLSIVFVALVLSTSPGCKPKTTCQPGEFAVQVVLHPGNPLNPDDDAKSLPTNVHLLQLTDNEQVGRFDIEALRADPKAALGESYVAHDSFVVWQETDEVRRIKPKADTRYLLLVAEYRQMIGSSWYLEYEVPYKEHHEDAVCTAVHRKRPPLPDPCFYVLLERYETRGGASPSLANLKSGHKIRGKMIRCAPPSHQYVIDPKIAQKQARQRRRLDPSKIPTRLPTLPNSARGAAGAAGVATPAATAPSVTPPSAAPPSSPSPVPR